MIEASDLVFPQNAVKVISEGARALDADMHVFRRPLRESDPNQSIGVFGAQWLPNEDSYEMRGGPDGPSEPTLQRYTVGLQAFVKDMDEMRGLSKHGVLAKLVRTMLYRDADVRVGLRSLVSTAGGSTERMKRWGINTQRLISNELNGSWLYLSTLECWIETETI